MGAATDFFHQFAKQAVDGVLNATLLDDIWKGLQARIGAHGMDNYRRLVAKLFRS